MKNKKVIIIIILLLILNLLSINFYTKGYISKTIKNTYFVLINNIKKIRSNNTFITNDNFTETKELKEEVERLKEVLKLNKTITNYNYINSTIISRNTNYWYNTIIIDKGSKDGIKINNPAVIKEGLIGKVIETTYNTSTIELLSHENYKNKISIKIDTKEGEVYGLITNYNYKDNTYTVEGISDNKNIEIGNTLYTTGLSEIYPSGIKVGEVLEIKYDNFELTKILKVTPSVNFNNISYITILI